MKETLETGLEVFGNGITKECLRWEGEVPLLQVLGNKPLTIFVIWGNKNQRLHICETTGEE